MARLSDEPLCRAASSDRPPVTWDTSNLRENSNGDNGGVKPFPEKNPVLWFAYSKHTSDSRS